MSKWVLVPSEFDDETCEDIWNVAYGEWAEFGSMDKDAGRAAIVAMLAARPPVPRAVWDEMVEQAHVALWTAGKYNGVDTALRAALGYPQVEGDEP
jgi:hypothetical protein